MRNVPYRATRRLLSSYALAKLAGTCLENLNRNAISLLKCCSNVVVEANTDIGCISDDLTFFAGSLYGFLEFGVSRRPRCNRHSACTGDHAHNAPAFGLHRESP